jgi:hypothetical protein
MTAAPAAGATTGKVTVVEAAGSLVTPQTFKVVPTIQKFTPTSGHVGAAVVSTGMSLSQTGAGEIRNCGGDVCRELEYAGDGNRTGGRGDGKDFCDHSGWNRDDGDQLYGELERIELSAPPLVKARCGVFYCVS